MTEREPLLCVTDLEIRFGGGAPAVANLSFEVAAGQIVALVGESGSGKTLTARAVIGLLPGAARATGSIRLAGCEVVGAAEATLAAMRGRTAGLVLQDPQSALNPVRTIGWQLAEAVRAHDDLSRPLVRERVVALLGEVELPDPRRWLRRYPHQLSGGQRQRVTLALALAGGPALLVADEPTTALDTTVQAEILDLLARLAGQTSMGVLLITHDLGLVAERADRVVVLEAGRLVEAADTVSLFSAPRHPTTRRLLAALPRLPSTGPGVIADKRPSGPAVFVLESATLVYPSRRGSPAVTALDNVNVEVRPGEMLAVVGESGSGKTTLGRIAAGLLTPGEGRVRHDGADLARVPAGRRRALRQGLALVHQDPASSLDPRFTVEGSIREPLDAHRVGSRRSRDARVRELLDAVRLPLQLATRRPHQLSGGQRQRVALARALALRPRLLIADEPTSALDTSVQAEIVDLLAELRRELGFAGLFISHDLAIVSQVADRVAVLRSGRLVEDGRVEDVLGRPRDAYTQALLDAVPVPRSSREPSGPGREGC